MVEVNGLIDLLMENPELFPESGRTVEILSRHIGLSQTVIKEYRSIEKNLGKKGKEAFRRGEIEKSAAYELSKLPEEEQDRILDEGSTSYTEIRNANERTNLKAKASSLGSEGATSSEPVGDESIEETEVGATASERSELDDSIGPEVNERESIAEVSESDTDDVQPASGDQDESVTSLRISEEELAQIVEAGRRFIFSDTDFGVKPGDRLRLRAFAEGRFTGNMIEVSVCGMYENSRYLRENVRMIMIEFG